MSHPILSPDALSRALSLRDLADPAQGPHAMQLVVDAAVRALAEAWHCAVVVHRAHPVVPVADNYDRLHYPPDGAARDARHTRYVSASTLLRTQTSALVPPLLRRLAGEGPPGDALLVCPGLVYRRDTIDRLHTGEPHQVDLWRIRRGRLASADLEEMIRLVTGAVLPGREVRAAPAAHPYTTGGLQVDVRAGEAWVEVGECGLALPALIRESGLEGPWTALAMGLGLDRIVMLRKGIEDIRLLRSPDPRVAGQMLDLSPWRPVSAQPPVRRDLSVAVAADATPEELGDRVRAALGERAACVEEVAVVSETPLAALPPQAAARLGIGPGQKNVLLRVVLRHPTRTLTHGEANGLRDEVYAALHEGRIHHWAAGAPPGRVRRTPPGYST